MKLALIGTLACATAVYAAQILLGMGRPVPPEDGFTVLASDALPAHQLRIKQVPGYLCDPSVRSFSGYMDVDVDKLRNHYIKQVSFGTQSVPSADEVEAFSELATAPRGTIEHFYFWAFESRDKPADDPHLLWLNGGPGCSSFTGLLMELGPCNAADPSTKDYKTAKRNPYAWNDRANMIFLDQPVGVGFSYVSWADPARKDPAPGRIYSTSAAARDASAFLHLLTAHAQDIFGREKGIESFHISGESFAGRYIPLIAAQVVRDNKAWQGQLPPVPLEGVAIGNGITNPLSSFKAYHTFACTNQTADGPYLDDKTCKGMEKALPTCLDLTRKCNKIGTNLACSTATTFCEGALSSKWDLTNSSIYDYKHSPPEYAEEEWVKHLLNLPSTWDALGIDHNWPGVDRSGGFVGCSDAVGEQFDLTGDGARTSVWAVQEILRAGVRVMSYGGKRDFICNVFSLGPEEGWTEVLDWEYGDEFRAQPLVDWYESASTGKRRVAGQYKTYANLTFASVDEAGHFVPHDQPQAAQVMINRWLHTPGDGSL